jgi:hypothetical protein
LVSDLAAKAPLASPTFTGTVTLPTGTVTSGMIADGTIVNADINASAAIDWTKLAVSSTVSATELGYVDGVTSSIQTQLDAKLASSTAASTYAPIASPTFTGTVSGVTKSMVGLGNVDNTSDASKPISAATQTALDLKAPIANPTFTGTVAGVTKSMVGLGNVDNTSDANKPVSTATQTALDAKLALAGGTMTGALTLSGAPTSDLHATTKAYVDAAVNNINIHEATVAATTANIALATAVDNGKTLDGVTLATGDRILVKNQTTGSQNGIYIVAASGAPTRATDYDAAGEVSAGDFIFVKGGTVNANTGWIQTATVSTVGTDALSFTQFSGAGTFTAGNGLSLSGTSFSINTATTVDLNTTQTLTNKTLTSPTLTTPTLGVATATSINGTTIPSSKTLVTTADSGTVTSTMIADGTIVDGDISSSAAIATSKISGLDSALSAKAPLASPTFTGTVTVAASGIAFTDGTQTKEGVPSRTPINQQSGTTYTTVLSDRDSLVECSNISAITVTIPPNSSVAYPVGTSIDILQTNTGQVTIAAGAGVTVNATPGLKLRTQWSSATLFKRATDTWIVMGDLSA